MDGYELRQEVKGKVKISPPPGSAFKSSPTTRFLRN